MTDQPKHTHPDKPHGSFPLGVVDFVPDPLGGYIWWGEKKWRPEEIEDAKLIEAAPDLLAACKMAMFLELLWAPPGCGPIDYPNEIEALDDMRKQIEAAIAAAEGTP